MKENNLLEQMAKIISEIQTINIWIDDARTNRIARIRYQKSKPRLKDLVEAYKESRRSYDALQKEEPQCTSQK
jgi:hypothetical protein